MTAGRAETGTAAGVELLREGRSAEAEAAFRAALAGDPDDAQAHLGLGRILHGRRDFEAAVDHFRHALRVQPALVDARRELGRSLNNLRRLEEAEKAFRDALELAPEDADIHDNLGHVLRARGRLDEAARCFDKALQLHPGHVRALFNRGTICSLEGEHEQALSWYRAALERDPGDPRTLLALGTDLHTLGRLEEARDVYVGWLKSDPQSVEAHLNLGTVLAEMRRPEEAEIELRAALALSPESTEAHAQLASLLEELNRTVEAEEVARRGLTIDPAHGLLNLVIARCERRAGNLVAAHSALSGFDLPKIEPRLRRQFHFEFGLILDRLGEFADAWLHFERANELAGGGERAQGVDRGRYLDRIEHIRDFFIAEQPVDWPELGPDEHEPAPVFLLGFNRSGTTLAELALDAHESLDSIEEQPTLNAVEGALECLPGGYPAALKSLSSTQADELRAIYWKEVARHVSDHRERRVIDKLPLRTIHAGLISRLFPRAKIVLSVRHPCDVCLSNFMQQYEPSDTMANFDTIEYAAVAYDRVMSLWQVYEEKLALDYHVLRYEDLIDDFPREMRRLLDFIGVPWDERVIDYQSRARARKQINTNSYYQVTQPLYRDAVYRWKNYAPHFEPVMDLLRPYIRRFGYTDDGEVGS